MNEIDRDAGRARTDRIVRTLQEALLEIGCAVPTSELLGRRPAERNEAMLWAQAIQFGQDDPPERPGWLVAYDCPRCWRCGCTQERACPEGCGWDRSIEQGPICTACTAPTSLAELLEFLARRPLVRQVRWDGVVTLERFVRADAEGLHFVRESPGSSRLQPSFLPVNCRRGKAAESEGGLTFDPLGFAFTKFGKTVHCYYRRGPNA